MASDNDRETERAGCLVLAPEFSHSNAAFIALLTYFVYYFGLQNLKQV